VSAYRGSGADGPFGDPLRAHGVAMEGYYWRLWDGATGRSVMALCGVCRAVDGPWAVVALAARPGGFVRWVNAGSAWADPAGLGVAAWHEPGEPTAPAHQRTAAGQAAGEAVLRGSSRRLAVDLGPDARLDVVLEGRIGWSRRAFGGLGPAQVVPRLPQYWHPHLLGARVRGSAVLGGDTLDLEGWEAYAEKNWGGTFPGEWWWGQAGFGGGALVAFAGGRLGGPFAATAIVVRTAGGDVLRFAPPGAAVTAETGGGVWRLRARSPRHRVLLEGEATAPPLVLPVPVPAERRAVLRSEHHLGGRLRAVVHHGRRTLLREESTLAGLEHGTPG
jgi:tocopherol cyclase